MHGRELRYLTRRMPSTTKTTTAISNTAVIDSNASSPSFFLKDGRKISVGDCALFKPEKDSPPFVGIIRCWTSDRESDYKLTVNWLYRPAEVKLLKGVALVAAPNEVFYSFHSDEISAASLLHPCKVAFLPKGVELPPGVSSFVCRRVYDITNKCLWWLTDEDSIDDQHKEVNKLLHKTRIEMHSSVDKLQGSRSPKPVIASAASPLKHSPDSVQNSSSNLSSHGKGKKREQVDQSFDSSKQEFSSKSGDWDSGQLKTDGILNVETAKFSEKGLVDSEAVARLVRLMQPEQSGKKVDLTVRCMLAEVIAATDNFDCLNQFVQLRGLFVLNEWLQEVHKGKISNSGNLKNSDKSVDDFLLILLRALDKLPVNLNVLQTCNIGKSVNHLRSHKNSEIKKKARSLVDTWKKRVEDEMLINEEGRSQQGSSHGGSRYPSGSDAVVRSPITHQSSLKSTLLKHVTSECNSKSTSAQPGGPRSTLSPTSTTDNCKDGQSRLNASGGSSEPHIVVKEEKSGSSSQSHTNSQCSSDQGRSVIPCGKEGTRRSTAGSRSSNKVVSTTKHSKSANCPTSGIRRETALDNNSSMPKQTDLEKVSHSAVDASVQESNNHKLIVKISNRSWAPAQSVVASSLEDSACKNSIAPLPAFSEMHNQSDAFVRDNKHDMNQFTEADGSSTSALPKTSEIKKSSNVSNLGCSPFPRNEINIRKTQDSSFSPMNALIESCAKISEATVSLSAGDDVGMNLLASVAAGEILKSSNVSPTVSPHRSSTMAEDSVTNHVADLMPLLCDDVVQQGQPSKIADTDDHIKVAGVLKVNEETSNHCGGKTGNIQRSVEDCLKNNGASLEKMGTASTSVSVICTTGRSVSDSDMKDFNVELSKEENQKVLSVASQKLGGPLKAQDKVKPVLVNDEFETRDQRDTASCPPNDDADEKLKINPLSQSNVLLEQSTLVGLESDSTNTIQNPAMASADTNNHLAALTSTEVKFEKIGTVTVDDSFSVSGNSILKNETHRSASDKQVKFEGCCGDVDWNRNCEDDNLENQEFGTSALPASCDVALDKKELHSDVEGSKLTALAEEMDERCELSAESVAVSSASGGPVVDSKFGFDLNEGFHVDEGKIGESLDPGVVCPLQIPVSSAACGLPASITVASAAKGPFVPPDDLLRNKRELGWKGSAATSAFRPAEPRKAMEVLPGPSKSPLSDAPSSRPARFPLDIDLNVADESSDQEFVVKNSSVGDLMTSASLRSSGGLDLDLNKVDDTSEMVHVGRHIASKSHKVEVSTQLVNPSTSNDGATNGKRDFDLNDGPATQEMPFGQILSSQHNQSHFPFQIPLRPRINCSDTGNCFPWYPPGTSYPVSVTPSALPNREAFSIVGMDGGPQCVMSGPSPALSFSADAYRGSMLSSSPVFPFHSSPFQYPVLPYGTSFPLPTSAFAGGSSGYMEPAAGGRISAIPSQLVGNAAGVPFQYPHAYVVSRTIPDVANNGLIESSRNLGKQGLDLNSGPGVLDMERREESLPTVSRQVSTISSQSLAEEQARMYSMGGGHLKRKEPEGGWSIDALNFKQSSWR